MKPELSFARWIVPAALLLFLLWVPTARADATQDRGARLFQAKGCMQCHAINGIGKHKGPNLSEVGKRLQKPEIENQIRNGGKAMPPFKDATTPAEIHDLVEYLHKCRREIPPPSGSPAS